MPIAETLAESPVVTRRSSSKKTYSPSTLAKYSRAIEVKINGLIDSEMTDTNAELRLQVVNDVLQRLNSRDESKSKVDIGNVSILGNIKSLVTSMRLHGNNDREQHTFLEHIALAVSGDLSIAFLEASTGLSRQMIEYGRASRVTFEELVSTAEKDAKEKNLLPINEINRNLQEDYESEDETGDNSSVDSDSDEIQAGDSNKRKRSSTNIFREHLSSKSRKLRNDKINGSEVQLFCHESPWGGRVDTLKLSKQQVLLEQPLGGFEYETVRSYQFTVNEMHEQFIKSEYGQRQRLATKGKDLCLKTFRQLICPCMTEAKQRDAADEIVAEFKHCLQTWDVCMRKRDRHVRAEIMKCSTTECPQHKKGSLSADLYAKASKSTSHFLAYLLCPQIERSELAVKVTDGPSNYAAELEIAKNINTKAAIDKKTKQVENFKASNACRGTNASKLKKRETASPFPCESG